MRTRYVRTLMMGMLLIPASVGLSSAGAADTPDSSLPTGFLYSGEAYGTYVTADDTIVAGKSAVSTLCTSFGDAGHGTGVAGVQVDQVISTSTIGSAAMTTAHRTTVTATTQASVQDADLLSGLITAGALEVVSSSSHTSTGFHTHADGSIFTSLVVNGASISNPAPNTVIHLPQVGRVVVNQRMSTIGATSASLTVNLLHIYVTHELPGVAAGTEIIVAHATSNLSGGQVAGLDGQAYGTWVNGTRHVISGRSARVVVGCSGTKGILKTNSAAGVNAPPALATGVVTDTAYGSITGVTATGETTAETQAISVLSGLVTADAVKVVANASTDGDQVTLSDAGTTFGNLIVNGDHVASDVAPNTKIVVGNITVWLHRVILSDSSIEVRGIEAVVTGTNPYGLAVGTRIQVAVALMARR